MVARVRKISESTTSLFRTVLVVATMRSKFSGEFPAATTNTQLQKKYNVRICVCIYLFTKIFWKESKNMLYNMQMYVYTALENDMV